MRRFVAGFMRRFAVGVLRIFRRAFGGVSGVFLRRFVCGVLRRVCPAFCGGRFAAFIWRGFGRFCAVLFAVFCGGICGGRLRRAFCGGRFFRVFFGAVIRGGVFF